MRKIIPFLAILIICAIGLYGYDYAYDKGYDVGYKEGFHDMQESYDSGYYEPSAQTQYWSEPENVVIDSYSDTDDTVWVTPDGRKYHNKGCRYTYDRTDLYSYATAYDAEQAGYTPCSVCH